MNESQSREILETETERPLDVSHFIAPRGQEDVSDSYHTLLWAHGFSFGPDQSHV